MRDYSLNLFPFVGLGAAPIGDITPLVQGWERSTRGMGGFWEGSFTIDESGLTRPELERWFYENLGYHLLESTLGVDSWEGQIYEMDLVINGHRKRRTLRRFNEEDAIANRIKAVYVDEAGDVQETTWASQAQSIARHGQIDEIIRLDGYQSATAAARRDTALKRRAWAWARTVSLSHGQAGASLEVKVWGYVHTSQFRYVTSEDGNTGNLSAWISSIINTDCEFLTAGKIATNTLQVKRTMPVKSRAWDMLLDLCEMGDASGNAYRLFVGLGRKLHYEQMNPTPIYYWQDGQVWDLNHERVHPRLVQPGVVRDLNYPQGAPEPGSFFQDARDTWAEEVQVDPKGGLQLRTGAFNDADILAAQEEFFQTQEDYIDRTLRRAYAEWKEAHQEVDPDMEQTRKLREIEEQRAYERWLAEYGSSVEL